MGFWDKLRESQRNFDEQTIDKLTEMNNQKQIFNISLACDLVGRSIRKLNNKNQNAK